MNGYLIALGVWALACAFAGETTVAGVAVALYWHGAALTADVRRHETRRRVR